MSRAIRFYETGGPEVLKLEQTEVGAPGPGQARVRHSYVAVNSSDIPQKLARNTTTNARRMSDRKPSGSSAANTAELLRMTGTEAAGARTLMTSIGTASTASPIATPTEIASSV